jgi:hypothetical protein
MPLLFGIDAARAARVASNIHCLSISTPSINFDFSIIADMRKVRHVADDL